MHKSASLPHHTKYHATHSILQLFSANGEGRKGSLLVCEGLSAAAHSATTCSVPEKAGELFLAARRVRDLLSLSLQVCKGVSLCVSASAWVSRESECVRMCHGRQAFVLHREEKRKQRKTKKTDLTEMRLSIKVRYGVALVSRIDKITCLFCRRALWKR